MKNYLILFYLFCYTLNFYSQNKTIAFFDNQKKPITNFQLNFFVKDSLSVYKSNGSNFYYFKQSLIKEIDSVFITFDSFYSQKINIEDLAKKDYIFLKKEISLEEVIINKKFEREELGVISKNRNIFKIGDASSNDELIEINVNNNLGASIESISLYLFEKFRDLYHTKHNNKNLDIKFYLFQSDINPNEGVVNLLENELIINTEKGEKGWLNIDLRSLNIKIKNLKYLYIGYSTFGNPIAVGAVRRKRLKLDTGITSYLRSSDKALNRKWRKSHYKVYIPDAVSEPAIKIGIKY